MGKYIVIYHAPKSALEATARMTPEEMQEGMALWMAWATRCGESLVDMGAPLSSGQRITKSGTTPSNGDIVFYSVLEAENMEAAQALLADHPHLEWAAGCEIEVYEAMSHPG
jgi:hypothetical protein